MNRIFFLNALVVLTIISTSISVNAQAALDDKNIFLGKWVTKDAGVEITQQCIVKLYKDDAGWHMSGLANDSFYFIDTVISYTSKTFESWTVSEHTSLREYLLDGTERSREIIEFRVYGIELIDSNTIRLSFSKPYTINQENIKPVALVTAKMKENFLAEKAQQSFMILRRLRE